MRDFKKYEVWQISHKTTLEIYRLTSNFPKDELFGLTSQLRRSSSSIGLNIAEGCGRSSDTDFKRFLIIAYGSANETEYAIILSKALGYISLENSEILLENILSVKMMLGKLINKLKTDINNADMIAKSD